jgi:hypothetical protein
METMNDPLQEIAVAGKLASEQVARLEGLDVGAIHSIGIAGPWTPELLIQVHEAGAAEVADFVHTLPLEGPMDPDDLSEMLRMGIDTVKSVVNSRRGAALRSDEVVELARRA